MHFAVCSTTGSLSKGVGCVAHAFSPDFLLAVAATPVEQRTLPDAAALVHYLATLPSFAQLPYDLRAQLARWGRMWLCV